MARLNYLIVSVLLGLMTYAIASISNDMYLSGAPIAGVPVFAIAVFGLFTGVCFALAVMPRQAKG